MVGLIYNDLLNLASKNTLKTNMPKIYRRNYGI